MEDAGFRRWVSFWDGTWKLPTDEYLTEVNSGFHGTIRDKAVAAANLTRYSKELFVAEVNGGDICSAGLKPWREFYGTRKLCVLLKARR